MSLNPFEVESGLFQGSYPRCKMLQQTMRRNGGDYIKCWGAALIRGAATNPEFTVIIS